MDRKINYERFSGLRAVVGESGLEDPEEQERAFRKLVDCLVSKNVYHPNGDIVRFRDTCLNYFAQICPRLEQEELELMIESVDDFYKRFIFAPCDKVNSLYWEFKKMRVESKFNGIPVSQIFERYRQETDYSPYEKTTKDEIYSFLRDVENSMFALA
jgi:hypothetical protein